MSRDLFLVAWLALAVVGACAPSPEATDAPGTLENGGPRNGGTLVTTNRNDVDSVNDLVGSGSVHARDVERMLFLQLALERPAPGREPSTFEPQLAERWEHSDDGLELTFHLREASWSDGTPLTAADVRWTWQAQTDPDVAYRLASRKGSIVDVEVIDDRTVRFRFAEPSSEQLEIANTGAILPRHAWGARPFSEWRTAGRWFTDTLVSSGPFVLTRWEPKQEMVLDRNARYYKPGLPRLDRVVVRIVPDKTTQLSQLLGGAVDYVRAVPGDQIERLESSPRVEIESYAGRNVDYLCWNTRRPPLDSAEVRRALTLATDRQSIVDAVYRGYARVSATTFLSSAWAIDESLEPWPYDPAAASRLLAAHGVDDDQPLRLELLVQSGNRVHLDAATLLQAQLARVGVQLEIRPAEFQTWVERVKSQQFDAAIGGWAIPTNQDMSFAFHSREIGGFNFGAYANLELDALLERAAAEGEPKTKRQLLHEVQAMLHREQPYTFLWEPLALDGRSVRLRDVRPNQLSSYFNIDEWWLTD